MAHPYPPRWSRCDYIGRHRYFLTFCTDGRRATFTDAGTVSLVLAQFLRAARQHGFEITAYCFMPDHVHLLIAGLTDRSDARAFIRAAKQYSGYSFSQATRRRLWQRYGYERLVRSDEERALKIRYMLANPIVSGLARESEEYPFLGSERYTIAELLAQAGLSGSSA
jgi:putative transposase